MKRIYKKCKFIGYGEDYVSHDHTMNEYSFIEIDRPLYNGCKALAFQVSKDKIKNLCNYKIGKLENDKYYCLITEDYENDKKFKLSSILPYNPDYKKSDNQDK